MVMQEQYNVMFQKNRVIFVKIDLLDFISERRIDSFEGYTTGGSIQQSNDGSIRRTCKISMVLRSEFVPSQDSKFWLNRKIRIYIGILNQLTDEVIWYDRGLFVVSNPTINYSVSSKTFEFEALDLMCLYNGDMSGQLGSKQTVVQNGIPIHEAVKILMGNVGGVKKLNIETTPYNLPYTIKKFATDTYWTILEEIKNLYRGYEAFFDTNGFFVFRKFNQYKDDPVQMEFKDDAVTYDGYTLTTNITKDDNFKNARNRVVIYGKLKDDGTQIKYEVSNNDISHPFSIPSVGERLFSDIDEDLYTQEMAQLRAEYELFIHSNFSENINITCLNLYNLKVNDLIYVRNKELKIDSKYIINSIAEDLRFDGMMSLSCSRIYE